MTSAPHSARRRAAPSRLARAGARAGERGMTLIEISIAVGLVALLVAVALPSMEAFTGIKAKEEAGRISGAIRYMFGISALSGKVCRITFDLDAGEWWPECTAGRFTIGSDEEPQRGGSTARKKLSAEEREAAKERQKEEAERKKLEEEKAQASLDESEQMRARIEKKAEFAEFTDQEAPRRKLPDGAEVSVWTAHQREKFTNGTAYLYFFPQGHTERAHIYVSSGHGDVYTLVVSPLSGRVKVVGEELDVPRR